MLRRQQWQLRWVDLASFEGQQTCLQAAAEVAGACSELAQLKEARFVVVVEQEQQQQVARQGESLC
jgi:hypothetical protein